MKCIIDSKCPECGYEKHDELDESTLEQPSLKQFKIAREVTVICPNKHRYKTMTKVVS